MKLTHTALGCVLAGWALVPASAAAQDFPSRAIKFVVPFTAGSATDTLARVLGQKLNATQGWTVVIENMAGASGQTAASNVEVLAARLKLADLCLGPPKRPPHPPPGGPQQKLPDKETTP